MNTSILMYATDWCGDCKRSTYFLDKNNVPYQYINIEKNEAALAEVLRINHGLRSVPTIVFPNGTVLVEPSNESLKNAVEENHLFMQSKRGD